MSGDDRELQQRQQELDRQKDALREEVQGVLNRGPKADDLEAKSNALQDGAQRFENSQRRAPQSPGLGSMLWSGLKWLGSKIWSGIKWAGSGIASLFRRNKAEDTATQHRGLDDNLHLRGSDEPSTQIVSRPQYQNTGHDAAPSVTFDHDSTRERADQVRAKYGKPKDRSQSREENLSNLEDQTRDMRQNAENFHQTAQALRAQAEENAKKPLWKPWGKR